MLQAPTLLVLHSWRQMFRRTTHASDAVLHQSLLRACQHRRYSPRANQDLSSSRGVVRMLVGPMGDEDRESSSNRTSLGHREVTATTQSFVAQPIRCDTTRAEWDWLLLVARQCRHRLQHSPEVRGRARCNSHQWSRDAQNESIANNAVVLRRHVLQVPCGRNRDEGLVDCWC